MRRTSLFQSFINQSLTNMNSSLFSRSRWQRDVRSLGRLSQRFRSSLRGEGLEQRLLMAADIDDSISEAISLGAASTTPTSKSGSISPDVDVDMFRFSVTSGQVVDIDIDTPQNGPGGLGSYLRLFNSLGQQLAANDDAAAPGENVVGFDSLTTLLSPTIPTRPTIRLPATATLRVVKTRLATTS
jgi:hypothetical protein